MVRRVLAAAFSAALVLTMVSAHADEGMWTVDNFPSAAVKAHYGFGPDTQWLEHVRDSAVRLTSGCSASLVSKDGLILTNHHCAVDCVQTMSTADHDFVADGYVATTRAGEKLCPGMQAEILMDIRDVTATVLAAMKAADPKDAIKARDAAYARIGTQTCGADPLSRCQVISLYQGGQYKLYKYRKYRDVRLVFAPEFSVSFFGGDPDNFNFPRYCLDSAFVRLYENDKPASTPTHLSVRVDPPKAGEVVFVAGNPGSTSRLKTLSQLRMQRDWVLPIRQLVRSELRGRLITYMGEGPEAERTATDTLFDVENSFKAIYGMERALLDPDFLAIKAREEQELRRRVKADPKLSSDTGDPWTEISKATARYQEIFLAHDFLEQRAGSMSQLYQYARVLVRGAAERRLPNTERLPEFSDDNLLLAEKDLLDARPIYPDLERMGLELWLSKTREYLTVDNVHVQHLLGKESPSQLAARLAGGTRLADSALRAELWKGGQAAIDASNDPLIRFVAANDANARAIRKTYEQEVEGPITRGSERIARARFAVYGDKAYPDATFTLRISYGSVAGWTYQGDTVRPFTHIGGLYQRATGSPPFKLPQRWLDSEQKLDPETVLDFTTTNDVIGGNSGSPVIDSQGRVIGAVFDLNTVALGGAYGYEPKVNRTIAVSAAAILAALRNVYGAEALADELEGR
jgi:hypothetical protein